MELLDQTILHHGLRYQFTDSDEVSHLILLEYIFVLGELSDVADAG